MENYRLPSDILPPLMQSIEVGASRSMKLSFQAFASYPRSSFGSFYYLLSDTTVSVFLLLLGSLLHSHLDRFISDFGQI